MPLFTTDKEQDARLDAVENHLRAMSEAVQQTQLDVMTVNISLIRLESNLGKKVSTEDVDASILSLNEQLGIAREEYEKTAAAAEESWATLHDGAASALSTLRSSVQQASDRIARERQD